MSTANITLASSTGTRTFSGPIRESEIESAIERAFELTPNRDHPDNTNQAAHPTQLPLVSWIKNAQAAVERHRRLRDAFADQSLGSRNKDYDKQLKTYSNFIKATADILRVAASNLDGDLKTKFMNAELRSLPKATQEKLGLVENPIITVTISKYDSKIVVAPEIMQTPKAAPPSRSLADRPRPPRTCTKWSYRDILLHLLAGVGMTAFFGVFLLFFVDVFPLHS